MIALDKIAVVYDKALVECKPPKTPKEIAGFITSAISESVVLNLLLNNGKRREDITLDAHIYTDKPKPISPKNIDFVWCIPTEKKAGIYECKNQPNGLLYEYESRDRPGHEIDWKRSKTWLLLELQNLLIIARWTEVHLAVVTLRARESRKDHLDIPPNLQIYYQEDLTAFPRHPPKSITTIPC